MSIICFLRWSKEFESHVIRVKLSQKARKLGGGGTLPEKTAIQDQRQRLQSRINTFHQSAENFYSALEDDQLVSDDDEDHEAHLDDEEGDEIQPEALQLKLPSSLVESFEHASVELQRLATQELGLREGQANDALKQLRLLIGHKALLFRQHIRKASTTSTRTRAWDDVNSVEDKIKNHTEIYQSARTAIIRLGAPPETLQKYQELEEEHLKVSKDIVNAARTGQRNDVLPWIWKLDGQHVQEGDNWMDECKSSNIFFPSCSDYTSF